MLGAALGFLAPWNAVPGIFITLVQTIAGLSSYALARRFATRGAAFFGAAAYAANPYALLIIYVRSDFAELLACALMPVVLLAALQVCGLMENRGRSQPRALALFAVVAVQCACRGAGKLQRGTFFCVGRIRGEVIATAVARRGRCNTGLCPRKFLSLPRGL
jgi:hypothetical protein